MQLNNCKDYFLAEQVECFESFPDYEKLIGLKEFGFNDRNFSTQGTKLEFKKVCIDRKDTLISGIYRDTTPIAQLIPYEVKIYIRYEEE